MKNFTIKTFNLLALSLIFVATSCVQDDEFSTPDLEVTDPDISGNIIDIDAVLGAYNQEGELFTFENTNNYVEGYVISNDAGGNFFKQLIIQDKPENPTAGIGIEVDVSPLFTTYDIGRKIYVKLDGLSVGIDNGVIKLGRAEGNSIARISASDMDKYILRTSEVATIVPLTVAISDFSDDLENLFIRLPNVQFNRFDVLTDNPKTFASEDGDQFDGERVLESCNSDGTVVLSTSTFADFKGLNLPAGSGSVDGVLVRDFFDDFYTIYLNSPEDVNFDSTDRCDPPEVTLGTPVDCENVAVTGDVVFFEDFEAYSDADAMEAAGWVVENFSQGDTEFIIGSFSGNRYAQISGFNSGESTIDTWLITPSINMDETASDELNFDIQVNFDNGKILTVLVSNDYSGSIEDATWSVLQDANIPRGPGSTFGSFVSVNSINTSCVSGSNVRIAFRYQGSDPSATTRYHIDNVEVSGE